MMQLVTGRAFGLALLCFVLFFSQSFGQPQSASTATPPKVVPPSPNAASLGKYGEIPVGFYTGVPNISIPLYTIQYRDITVPISISYHAGGIKVDEEASRVGLGWSLNAGGVISRTVMGGDDFEGVSSSDFNYFSTDELPTTSLATIQGICNTHFGLKEKYHDEGGQYDFEPDHYAYNFLGYAGKFVLDRSKNAVMFNQQKIRISPVDNEANAWKVQTADGYAYEFAEYETYRDNQDVSAPDQHKSSWYLTKITSPSGAKVEFFYTAKAQEYIRTVGAFMERRYEYHLKSNARLRGNFPAYIAKPVPGKAYSKLFLSAIDFTTGQMQFEYEAREDLEGEERLKAIKVIKKLPAGGVETNPSREFLFGYDYFVGNYDQRDYIPQAGIDAKVVTHRLKLLSVTEKGGGALKNPYRFKYNEEGPLPAKNSFARDHWGYHNGKWSNTSLIPGSITRTNESNDFVAKLIGYLDDSRDVNPQYNQLFILKEIEYPTKGRTQFFYEANRVDPDASQKNDRSIFAKIAATLYDETASFMHDDSREEGVHNLDFSDMYVGPDGALFPVMLKARFKLRNGTACSGATPSYGIGYRVDGPTGASMGVSVGLNTGKCNTPYPTTENPKPQGCLYCDSEQQTSGLTLENTYNNVFRPGIYTAHATFPAGTPYDIMSAIYHYKALKKNVYAGGLRVQKIVDYPEENDVQKNVKRFVYTYKADKNEDGVSEEYSSGIRMTMPQYAYFETEALEEEYQYANGVVEVITGSQTLLIRSSDRNIILNGSAQGSTVGHSQVEVLLGENGESGKSVYVYENEPDNVIPYNQTYTVQVSSTQDYVGPFPVRPPAVSTTPNARNGLLSKVTDYVYVGGENPYRPVKETVNNYRTAKASLYNAFERRPRGTRKTVYVPDEDFPSKMVIYSEQVYNLSCSSLLYFYPSSTSSWIHESNSKVKVFDQNGADKYNTIETEYFFENPTHQQVTRTVQTGSNGDKITTKLTYPADFTDAEADVVVKDMKSDNRYMHSRVLQQTVIREKNSNQEVISSQITTFGYADGTANAPVMPAEVALLRTATPLSLNPNAPEPFPPYTPAAGYNQNRFKPELKYEKYDKSGSLVQVRQANGIPITYLWGYNSAYPVAEIKNATYSDVKTALSVSAGEIELGAGALSQAQIAALQDKLKQAMITTFTYDPLKGMTSQTGPDGVTLTYAYDDLGRLVEVKDHLGNLVKHYEYHYKKP